MPAEVEIDSISEPESATAAEATSPPSQRQLRLTSTHALTALTVLAIFYTLHAARAFLMPIGIALLLSLLLQPITRRLKRWRVPEPVGALLVLALFLGAAGYGISYLVGPASEWAEKAPATLRKIEQRLRPLKKPVEQVSQATAKVSEIADVAADSQPGAATVTTAPAKGFGRTILGFTWGFFANILITLMIVFFLLASGDKPLRQLVRALPTLADKKRAVEIATRIQEDISRYLTSITLVNLLFGTAVGLAMLALGMPNPILWGVLAAVTNYIPYLGAIVCGGVLAIAALLTFPDSGHALAVPGAFFALNVLESYVITPLFVARKLLLNPLVIFLGVSFWGWMWGVPGALLAVPFLAALKIFCDHLPRWRPIGEFLGD